ncbi:MAG TPA: hypothetical protein VFV50_00580 [Bdellovibrionales bacterium]|nr:hypothetical protein [Bdellovibrionales bacterium]
MKESLKPLLEQVRAKLGNPDEIRENVMKNLAQTREVLEVTAKEVVRQTKESRLFTEYVRPAVESPKAEEALSKLEARVTQASPLVAKLREMRQQLLDATKPASGETASESAVSAESAEKTSASGAKTRKKKSSKASD